MLPSNCHPQFKCSFPQPTRIHQNQSTSKLYQEYSISWIVENIKSLGSQSLKTPAFSPVPNSDVALHFEIWYQEIKEDRNAYFKIIFEKSHGVNVPESMKMNFTVTINTVGGEVLKKFQLFNVSVNKMDNITVSNGIITRAGNYPLFGYYSKLIIECNLVLFEHIVSPTAYFHGMQLLKHLKEFVKDFDCIYQPSFLNDVEFQIGDESLPAHKSILAAHSTVFQRMMRNDFLETKIDTISINDSSPEMFKCFLKYLYSGEIEDKSWPVVKELFILAVKYDVRILKKECGRITTSILSVENVCDVLKIAYEYGVDNLKQQANAFAVKHILEIAPKNEWKELIDSNPIIGYNVMKNFAPKFFSIASAE